MDTGAGKIMHCASLKPSTFKYPQKVSDYGGRPLGSRHCSCWVPDVAGGAIATKHGLTITFVPMGQWNEVQGDHSQWFHEYCSISCFLVARHSVCNSLQLFQWLVVLQSCGQNYSSSVSQLIACEAVVVIPPRFEIKDPRNINNTNKLHSSEVALDI